MNISSSPSPNSTPADATSSDPVYLLKAHAERLQAQAVAEGRELKRAAALEAVAKSHGYRDWNAAVNAARSGVLTPRPIEDGHDAEQARPMPTWIDVNQGLPNRIRVLDVRQIMDAEPRQAAALEELRRISRQIEFIATLVPVAKDRREGMQLLSSRIPYVFVQDRNRFSDDLFHLCDRGYDPIAKLALSQAELVALGVDVWNEQYGTHEGDDSFSVLSDSVVYSGDVNVLKQAARLLALIAQHIDDKN